jgi:polyisoprenyl-teichoic acid--peptidoglycan teichoic acid transferase
MSNQTSPKTRVMKRKRKRKLRRRVYVLLIPILLFLSVIGYAIHLYTTAQTVFSDSHEDDGREKSALRETTVDPKEDNVSVLIMGVDASDIRANADNSRTDTLMVATLNKKDKTVKLLSIPRDSKVYIPEVGYEDRINHAHAFGGTEATIETVENLLGIPIDYWVKVNFEAFIDVVDAVDGITVNVPYEFYEQNSQDVADAIHLYAGEQELNGEEALAFARTRKADNDIERGKRQQEVIKAIVKKSISLNSILKYDDIIKAVGSNMTTNMKFDEMKSFITYGTSGGLNIDSYSLEGYDSWEYVPKKKYYWVLDQEKLDETKQILQSHLELSNTQINNVAGTPSDSTTN